MDPNANLAAQLRLAARIQAIWDHCGADGRLTVEQRIAVTEAAGELADLVTGLNGWLSNGGFMPAAWKRR